MLFQVLRPSLTPRDIEISEVRKYLSDTSDNAEVVHLLNNCIEEARGVFSYNICYVMLPVSFCESTVDFGICKVKSASLKKLLLSSNTAVLFGATVGTGIDALIRRYSGVSPSKALCFHAIGTERVEALCDTFEDYLRSENHAITTRFSPGYGDLPLDFQRDIFKILDCPKNAGISLTDSLLMTPGKSVTAVLGITEE